MKYLFVFSIVLNKIYKISGTSYHKSLKTYNTPKFAFNSIQKVFTKDWHGSNLCHVTWTFYINFRPPCHGGYTWNLALTCLAISKENMFEHCVRTTTDGRQSMGFL